MGKYIIDDKCNNFYFFLVFKKFYKISISIIEFYYFLVMFDLIKLVMIFKCSDLSLWFFGFEMDLW